LRLACLLIDPDNPVILSEKTARMIYMKRKAYLLNGLAGLLLLSGCMGYRLGGGQPEGIETVAMAPVINRTTEPAIEIDVTQALRQRLQFDGRLKLVNETGTADGVIEVTLTDYTLSPIAYDSTQRTTPNIYRLRVTGVAELKNRATGEVVSKSETYGEATFTFETDLTSSKRDALPTAAKEIAKFMVDDLIEQW
jgi:hypothetical protein